MKRGSFLVFLLLTSLQLPAQSLYFPPTTGSTWDTIAPQTLGYCPPKIDSLYAFLNANNTKAFILLKDGKIVLEKYFGTHTQTSPWQWASAGKTITSFMVGIAQQEGYLSINDTTSDYLGQGWTACTSSKEERITIRHHLTMTSGLDDNVADPFCTVDTCLLYKADAGTRWAYHNAPYTLLDEVLQNATGQTLNNYTTQKLKNPIGMNGSFLPVGFNNVFYSTARSMARFGLLVLNKGNWNGNQILTDTNYFQQMVNTSQLLNNSYGFLWWLNGKSSFMIPSSQIVFQGSLCPKAPVDMFAAAGKGGQLLNVVPSQNLVWIRMGDDPNNVPVPFLLNDAIWGYVNDLQCFPSVVNSSDRQQDLVRLFPNPCTDRVFLRSEDPIAGIKVFNACGQLIGDQPAAVREVTLSVSELQKGLYFVTVGLMNGKIWTGKFFKK